MSDTIAPRPYLRLFGPVTLEVAGESYPLGNNLPTALLVTLAITEDRDGQVLRDQLKDSIVYEGRDNGRDNKLYLAINRAKGLRLGSGASSFDLADVCPVEVDNHRKSLRWSIASDVGDFRQAIKDRDWTYALELYGSGFLAGQRGLYKHFPGLEEVATELQGLWKQAVSAQVEHLVKSSQPDLAFDLATQLIATDPGDFDAVARYAELALQTNNPELARAAIARLQRELGLDDLGQSLPNTLQRIYARLQQTKQKPLSQLLAPKELPAPTANFIGRGNELEELDAYLRMPSRRLITVVGKGGIGKTSLALRLARSLQRQELFADGVAWTSLKDIADTHHLASRLIEAVGLSPDPNQTPEQKTRQLVQHLKYRELLLVLDNFETTLFARDLLAELLQAAENLRVLVTSRQPLSNPEYTRLKKLEWVYRLEGIGYEEAKELFERSARQHTANFLLQNKDASAFEAVFGFTQGIPFAIELAAKMLQQVELSSLAKYLQSSIGHHGHSTDELLARIVDSSVVVLPQDMQQKVRVLAVFGGKFDEQAAQKIAQIQANELRLLINHSLVEELPDGLYDLHPVIRQHWVLGLDQSIFRQHAGYYGELASQVINNPASASHWLNQVINLQAAWRWYLKNKVSSDERLRQGIFAYRLEEYMLASQLLEPSEFEGMSVDLKAEALLCKGLLMRQRNFAESEALFQKANSLLEGSNHLALRGEVSYALGLAALDKGEPKALELLKQSQELLEQTTDLRRHGRTLRALARCYAERQADLVTATECLMESYKLFQKAEDWVEVAKTLNSLAIVYSRQGKLSEAQRAIEQSAQIYGELGESKFLPAVALTKGTMARIADHQLEPEKAYQLYGEALKLFYFLGDLPRAANALANRSSIAMEKREFQAAAQDLSDALKYAGQSENKARIADVLVHVARFLELQGDPLAFSIAKAALDSPAIEPSPATLAAIIHERGRLAPAIKKRKLSMQGALTQSQEYLSVYLNAEKAKTEKVKAS